MDIFDGYEVRVGQKRFVFKEATSWDHSDGLLIIREGNDIVMVFKKWDNVRTLRVRATV